MRALTHVLRSTIVVIRLKARPNEVSTEASTGSEPSTASINLSLSTFFVITLPLIYSTIESIQEYLLSSMIVESKFIDGLSGIYGSGK